MKRITKAEITFIASKYNELYLCFLLPIEDYIQFRYSVSQLADLSKEQASELSWFLLNTQLYTITHSAILLQAKNAGVIMENDIFKGKANKKITSFLSKVWQIDIEHLYTMGIYEMEDIVRDLPLLLDKQEIAIRKKSLKKANAATKKMLTELNITVSK